MHLHPHTHLVPVIHNPPTPPIPTQPSSPTPDATTPHTPSVFDAAQVNPSGESLTLIVTSNHHQPGPTFTHRQRPLAA
ncbi:hypothetical protein M0805_009366 [Coniferiporia weirii]|nr:hypothetical protein M0805_009366 [Coniferiporia weirii]